MSSTWMTRLEKIAGKCVHSPNQVTAQELRNAVVCIYEIFLEHKKDLALEAEI